jgi:hypothetical protein
VTVGEIVIAGYGWKKSEYVLLYQTSFDIETKWDPRESVAIKESIPKSNSNHLQPLRTTTNFNPKPVAKPFLKASSKKPDAVLNNVEMQVCLYQTAALSDLYLTRLSTEYHKHAS